LGENKEFRSLTNVKTCNISPKNLTKRLIHSCSRQSCSTLLGFSSKSGSIFGY